MNGPPKQEAASDASPSKKRKLIQKTVVTVKIEGEVGKQRSEGLPSDHWSWRKYGQKPIKGSPYPRGYYRCSTSKGCSAKKQVERCKTDASILIITYTTDHNHPGPHLPCNTITPCEPNLKSETSSPPKCCPNGGQENTMTGDQKLVEKHELSMVAFSPPLPSQPKASEDNDFFDELEELTISPSFTSLVRSCSIFDERILLLP